MRPGLIKTLLKSYFIAFEAYLNTFIGIPSGPVAFLRFKDFMILLISSTVGLGNSNGIKFFEDSLNLIMLGWFL